MSPVDATGSPQTADKVIGETKVTVASKLAEVWFPVASVAVHVTFVVPTGIDEPLAGTHETSGEGSTRSVAVGGV